MNDFFEKTLEDIVFDKRSTIHEITKRFCQTKNTNH